MQARVGLGPDNEPMSDDATKAAGQGSDAPAATREELARAAELRQRVALGIRKKLEDDLASMLNAINEADIETVKLLIDQGFKLQNVVGTCHLLPAPTSWPGRFGCLGSSSSSSRSSTDE